MTGSLSSIEEHWVDPQHNQKESKEPGGQSEKKVKGKMTIKLTSLRKEAVLCPATLGGPEKLPVNGPTLLRG